MADLQAQLLKTLSFFAVLGFSPTWIEWLTAYQNEGDVVPAWPDLETAANELVQANRVIQVRGRVALPNQQALIDTHEQRTHFMPRKLRRARRVAAWLSRIDGVRFVALCNTTAMSHAQDESDLDFFVISRAGSLWQTRGWGTLPFKLFGLRPKPNEERDAVCLSFFLDDSALDLTPLMLKPDDPYFRFWFLELLPLFDDGVGQDLWQSNAKITAQHPFANRWIIHPQLEIKAKTLKIPAPAWSERQAMHLQMKAFNPNIKASMNQSTDVVVDEHHLKLHTEDGRLAYRTAYENTCRTLGLTP